MQMNTRPLEYLTVAEVAERLKLSERAVRAMLSDGRLARVRIKGVRAVRIPERAVRALVE